MKKVLLCYLISVILISISVYSETIVVNDSTEYSEDLNLTDNETINFNDTLTQSDYENLFELTQKLIELNDIMVRQSNYLDALNKRTSTSELRFTDTLEENSKTLSNTIDYLQAIQNETILYKEKTEAKIETLTTNINELNNQLYKNNVWNWIKVILAFLVGIYLTHLYKALKQRKKLYFVLRWIRNRIPIRF